MQVAKFDQEVCKLRSKFNPRLHWPPISFYNVLKNCICIPYGDIPSNYRCSRPARCVACTGVCRCWKAHIEKRHVDGWLKFTRLWIGTGVAAFQTRRLPCTKTEQSYTDAQFHYGRIDGPHAVFHRRAGSEVTPNQLARFLHPTSIVVLFYFEPRYIVSQRIAGMAIDADGLEFKLVWESSLEFCAVRRLSAGVNLPIILNISKYYNMYVLLLCFYSRL